MDEQLLRIVLPNPLLAEIDKHLAREGSSRTRADFVREAIEQRLVELLFGGDDAAPEPRAQAPGPTADRLPQPPLASEDDDLSEDPLLRPLSLADSRLPPPAPATVARPEAATTPVELGPMFLHGRDYPSLWCLWWLARWADDSPLELGAYLREVTHAAWTFADRLGELEPSGELRITTMFPTSTRNRDSASQTFQASAIGGLVRRRGGSEVVVGPLALWSVAQIYRWENSVVIAPTAIGLDLLAQLQGLSLELPHRPEHARAFIDHLRRHAPADHAAFSTVLELVADAPMREELKAGLVSAGISETLKLADVFAQAYVSRGREWGLIEPKLAQRKYRLTDLGASMLQSYENGTRGAGNHTSSGRSGPR